MNFSPRTPAELTPNALSRLLAEKKSAGTAVLDLTGSNPTRAGFAYPGAEILAALADPAAVRYEPAACGAEAARAAVAGYYSARGHAVDPRDVVLTASTSEAYTWLFKLLAAPGERVLAPRPSYPLFDSLAALEGIALGSYPLVYDARWRMDAAALRARLTPDTRAIVAVHPNNPTGSFLAAAEARDLLELSAHHGCAVISDEVFADFAWGADAERAESFVTARTGLAFALSGLSKVAGLPQLKLGWIVVAGESGARAEARERLAMIADTFLSVNTPVQLALPRLLALREPVQRQIRARVQANRAWLADTVARTPGCRLLAAEGGWYAVLEVPASRTDEEWVLLCLRADDVLVHPGYFFGIETEAFLVVSLLTPDDAFRAGLDRILARVRRA